MPPDSRLETIRSRQRPVFGPSIDALVRDIDARIVPTERPAFVTLIETWPLEHPDPDALFHRLDSMRATLGPPALPSNRKPGSPLRALIGVAIGAAVAWPVGFVLYMVAREVALPTNLWSSNAVEQAIIGAVVLAGAALGAWQGGRPSRLGHALLHALIGLLVGALVAGLLAGIIASTLGEVLGVSQHEGAFAMGVAFTVMPLAALIGGNLWAIRTGRRAWRSWAA